MNITSDKPLPWIIVSREVHFGAGQPKAVASLIQYLSRNKIPIHIVTCQIDVALEKLPSVSVHCVRTYSGFDFIGNLMIAWKGKAIIRKLKKQFPEVRVIVSGGNCVWGDINWVHYLHSAWLPTLLGAPLMYRIKERLLGAWYRREEFKALPVARLVITNSERTSKDAVSVFGIHPDQIKTVYYGTDSELGSDKITDKNCMRGRFSLTLDKPLVLFVGGFGHDRRKGFDTLLVAWRELCKSSDWDADLVMAGGGSALKEVAKEIKRDGLESRVRLMGYVSNIYELLSACDILISPVRYEPYGLNVQEAICLGLPVIVTAVAGIAEQYPPELADMLLSDSNDPEGICAALRKWRSDLPGWKNRFESFGNFLRSRSWDDMSREIDTLVHHSAVNDHSTSNGS